MKILILCTGNSCRSQMAHGILEHTDKNLQVYSAGTHPAATVNINSIKVMNELGIDISNHSTHNISEYLGDEFDYVITVCDNAKETCPVFMGKVHHRLHFGFEDPADAIGTEEEILNTYRKIRDQIKDKFSEFYLSIHEYKH